MFNYRNYLNILSLNKDNMYSGYIPNDFPYCSMYTILEGALSYVTNVPNQGSGGGVLIERYEFQLYTINCT